MFDGKTWEGGDCNGPHILHPPICSPTYSPTHPTTHLLTQLFTKLLIHLSTYPPTYALTYSPTYSIIVIHARWMIAKTMRSVLIFPLDFDEIRGDLRIEQQSGWDEEISSYECLRIQGRCRKTSMGTSRNRGFFIWGRLHHLIILIFRYLDIQTLRHSDTQTPRQSNIETSK